MAQKQQELAKIILQDPAVESLSSFIGADGTNTTLNSGRMSINLTQLPHFSDGFLISCGLAGAFSDYFGSIA
jgi:multidrug efflux pump subunit AcrB